MISENLPQVLNFDWLFIPSNILSGHLSHDYCCANIFCPAVHASWMNAPLLPPNPSCISFCPDNGLQISPPLFLQESLTFFSWAKVVRYLSCFYPTTTSYCSFLFPSITDEVTIYSISFFVLELMELLLHFWRINILALLVPPYLGLSIYSHPPIFDLHQGLLSTTYLVEIFFHTANGDGDEEEKKSVFVKIPLTGEAGKNFKQVIS